MMMEFFGLFFFFIYIFNYQRGGKRASLISLVFSVSVGCLKPQSCSPNCLMLSGDSWPPGWKPRRRDDIFSLGVTHHPFVKMLLSAGSVFLLLASLMTSCTSGTLLEGRDANGSATDGGFVPLVATKVNQIIAREGSCVLIDCNVSGDPFPSFQWFNSHGERLDTESEGEADCSCDFKEVH